ncbi:glutathione S-transferase family protein [Marinobacter sp. SS21]|uniref:glutathione S-transferase family protein n=1 Tax=Marinobacter sp. SS21 TaxID=2979460 RepID=UPI0023306C7D|nr:glutathione S-transferase family protein [Marinobacter sp. SS21]MDC0663399.1 glutathione S-transferase family protein [Marinobacter sp. SS21]
MYTLYYLPGACSRAIHALLHDLGCPVEICDRTQSTGFTDLNATGQVPVLKDKDLVLREGAAIILYLLDKHGALPGVDDATGRAAFLQQLMFANATLHPAYGRLFFIAQAIVEPQAQQQAFTRAAAMIEQLWTIVDARLASSTFTCGPDLSVVDMMLAVYAEWGGLFPVDIRLGSHVERMLAQVRQHPAFQKAVADEEAQQAA